MSDFTSRLALLRGIPCEDVVAVEYEESAETTYPIGTTTGSVGALRIIGDELAGKQVLEATMDEASGTGRTAVTTYS